VIAPRLNSLDDLAHILCVRPEDIRTVAMNADQYYAPYPKKIKPKPFARTPAPAKIRIIEPPTGFLRHLLGRIQTEILRPVQLPDYLMGGVLGKSVLDNVRKHSASRLLVRLDIKNYFPSIRFAQIDRIWRNQFGCHEELAQVLTRLTTYRGHLPQGAPTSMRLAYLFLHSIDKPIRELCARLGVNYTVWVDDMAFSGEGARQVIGAAIRTLNKHGLSVSRKKLDIMGPRSQKCLTGVVPGPRPTVTRRYLNRIRAGIHNLRTGRVPHGQESKYIASLVGRIAFVRSIDPVKADVLASRLSIVYASLMKTLSAP
jgi:RNA-directed DNA polymerase